ncbi:MAG: hypothetical protein FWG50_13995 [Kiritimatiellaeota bacterium]|nr:hypothetical protein [Kiritimatiellota bacterium]
MKRFICVAALCVAVNAHAQEGVPEAPPTLASVEEKIKAAPDDPKLHATKCKLLFAAGKQQEAVDFGKVALQKFIQAKDDLAWFILGSITTDKYRIDVHYNMGRFERADRANTRILMTRPYSFRVWSLDTPPQLVRIVDFEISYGFGSPMTAAVGEMAGTVHSNFGVLDTDADFATVKAKVLSVLGAKEVAKP